MSLAVRTPLVETIIFANEVIFLSPVIFLHLVAADQHEEPLQRTPISILRVFFYGYCILKETIL